MINNIRLGFLGLWLLWIPMSGFASIINYPNPHDDLVGQVQVIKTKWLDSYEKIARRYNVGYYELVEANPSVDPDHLHRGQALVIPTHFILPMAHRDGIVVNIAEMRLYYFSKKAGHILTEPVGIGRQGWSTPISSSVIAEKEENPIWSVPKSIQDDAAAKGSHIPDQVLPGPDNPLGNHAMRLSLWGFLIHGTNEPGGVGRRSSAGCIRMYPEGILSLFEKVTVGIPVHIVNEPFKIGMHQNELYLEVHKPLQEDSFDPSRDMTPIQHKIRELAAKAPLYVNWSAVNEVAQQQQGIPVRIGHLALKSPQNENAVRSNQNVFLKS